MILVPYNRTESSQEPIVTQVDYYIFLKYYRLIHVKDLFPMSRRVLVTLDFYCLLNFCYVLNILSVTRNLQI